MIEIKSRALRRTLRILIPFVIIPAVAIAGTLAFDARRHIFVSLLVASLAVLLFVAGFERREIGTRRMVIVSIMIALSVAGRFIPFFKPITALTVLTAIYLGGEAGFLVGALSALLSNFYFGQGPWTPFQMLAWGMIGLLAGFSAGLLRRSRGLLLVFGLLSGIVFSMAMDVWTVLWYLNDLRAEAYLSAIVAAIPHTVLYSLSDFLFLFLLAKPLGEKLNRIKIKYGV
jgi:energy-coupling factor transport system substrate-specific component